MNQLTNNVTDGEPTLSMNLHIIMLQTTVDGKKTPVYGLELRKTMLLNEQNNAFIEKLILASLKEDKPLIARVEIRFKDKLNAMLSLKKIGFDFEKKILP